MLRHLLFRLANNPTFFYRNNERIQQGELSQHGDKGCGVFPSTCQTYPYIVQRGRGKRGLSRVPLATRFKQGGNFMLAAVFSTVLLQIVDSLLACQILSILSSIIPFPGGLIVCAL